MSQKIIVISDIHLGSSVCQTDKLLKFLDNIKDNHLDYNKIIINGDLFDSFDSRLKKKHWEILSELRKISDKIPIIWVAGNHDNHGLAASIANMIGAKFQEKEYSFSIKNKKFLCIHGDKFDRFIAKYPILTDIADYFYRFIQRIDPSYYSARFLKRASKTYLRCIEEIREKAITYGTQRDYNYIICGHTHKAEKTEIYINSGCWTEDVCHYILIDHDQIHLKEFKS